MFAMSELDLCRDWWPSFGEPQGCDAARITAKLGTDTRILFHMHKFCWSKGHGIGLLGFRVHMSCIHSPFRDPMLRMNSGYDSWWLIVSCPCDGVIQSCRAFLSFITGLQRFSRNYEDVSQGRAHHLVGSSRRYAALTVLLISDVIHFDNSVWNRASRILKTYHVHDVSWIVSPTRPGQNLHIITSKLRFEQDCSNYLFAQTSFRPPTKCAKWSIHKLWKPSDGVSLYVAGVFIGVFISLQTRVHFSTCWIFRWTNCSHSCKLTSQICWGSHFDRFHPYGIFIYALWTVQAPRVSRFLPMPTDVIPLYYFDDII